MEEIEQRVFKSAEVRAAKRDGKPVIEGLGAVYNQFADLGMFVEIIEPGFFDGVLEGDIRGLYNHDQNIVLGRTQAGTMRVSDSADGLAYSIDVNPDDSQAMAVHARCARGDVSQSSFSFTVKSEMRDGVSGDEWEYVGDKVIRRLKAGGCRELYDTGPVTFPAYGTTSASARSKAQEIRSAAGQAPDAALETTRTAQAQARQRARARKLQIVEKLIK